MKVPLLDLKPQYRTIRREIDRAIRGVAESQHFILGTNVQKLEEELAAYCGVREAVGVSSGTDALLVALMALGIGRGDEVITSPYTFFATAGCIARCGATPVFVDIDPATYNIRPDLIEEKITRRTAAIIPVHLYGQCADMTRIMKIARGHRLAVIEDTAQALGATHRGRAAGGFGDVGVISFFPSKNLGAWGDAGMAITNDQKLAERMRRLRVHGSSNTYMYDEIGGNFRIDEIQAAILRVKLRRLDQWNRARQANARRYNRLLRGESLHGIVRAPVVALGNTHIYHQYVIRVGRRDAIKAALGGAGIGTAIYYPLPLHLQKCFAWLGYRVGDCPESERAARETLALPIYPEVGARAQAHVVRKLMRECCSGRS